MQRLRVWLVCALVLILFSSLANGQTKDLVSGLVNSPVKNPHTLHISYMGVHGMALLFARDGSVYGHHLPLYRAPHDYQIVYQLSVSKDIASLTQQGLITIQPEPFDLRRLIKGEVFSVKATVYQGHFERGGKVLFESDIHFEKPVYRRQIMLEQLAEPRFAQVELSRDETLTLHQITSRPSFDAVWLSHKQSSKSERVQACAGIHEIKEESGYDWQRTFQYLSRCFATPSYLEVQDLAQ